MLLKKYVIRIKSSATVQVHRTTPYRTRGTKYLQGQKIGNK